MKEITLKEVYGMGFVEAPHRPWSKDEPFLVKAFSNKWLDLFQKRGESIVYLTTIPDINRFNV